MAGDPGQSVTQLLQAASRGEPRAATELLPLVYEELRVLARGRLKNEPAGLTLQPTALVHEAFLRLTQGTQVDWNGRRHFFGAAAEAMRRILIERARRVAGPKHGGGRARVSMEEGVAAEAEPDWVSLDEALRALEAEDADLAELVKLRYFAGLGIDETAAALGVSPSKVDRDWRLARAFLAEHISGDVDGRG